MKKLFFLVGILCVSCVSLKPTAISIEPRTSVIQTTGKQDDLYVKANSWMAETFGSSKSVIQFTDKESGTVIGKYLFNRSQKSTGLYGNESTLSEDSYAIIKIQVKDNKAKINIAPNDYAIVENMYGSEPLTKDLGEQRIKSLISNFKKYMKNDKSTDWSDN